MAMSAGLGGVMAVACGYRCGLGWKQQCSGSGAQSRVGASGVLAFQQAPRERRSHSQILGGTSKCLAVTRSPWLSPPQFHLPSSKCSRCNFQPNNQTTQPSSRRKRVSCATSQHSYLPSSSASTWQLVANALKVFWDFGRYDNKAFY